ncbi:MAG TPA: hypothetical protein VGV61_03385, partial [Thermoanaerobaculia bacterium]|nr:hypothetical protein [Thermoanaerobaculia bacterium]
MLALGFLFTSWLPFALLLPWARRANGLRVAWLPALAGALAAAYAVITRRLWPEANIRVDLLPVLAVVFACDVVGLTIVTQVLLADRRAPRLTPPARLLARLAAVAGAAWLLVAGLGFSWSQLSLVRAVRRLDSGQRLLLAAKLRDRDSAAIAYGPLAAAEAQLGPWVGVWDLQPPAAWVRTMVIAGDRRVWVRFQCAVGECEAGPGTLELGDLGEAQATVGKMGGGGWALRLTTLPGGALRVGAAPLAGEARGPQTAAARRRVLPAAGPAIPGELT